MKISQYKLKIDSDTEIHMYSWIPESNKKNIGVLQIAHGMAEHSERYSDFAKFLVENGFAVYANDHRGHGKTAKNMSELGYFANSNGWNLVVNDLKAVSSHIVEKHPDKPLFVLGHSMGSFLMREYIMNPPSVNLAGAILVGTAGNPGVSGKLGFFISKLLMLFNKKHKSKLMNNLSFGACNRNFKPSRTQFDWLSRDNEEVDKYLNDPYCGYFFTTKAFNDLIGGLLYVSKQENINKTLKDLPICLISGGNDPIGNNGKGVVQVYNYYQKAELKNIRLKLFDECRHEVLNETNKTEVYAFILAWLNTIGNF